MVIKAFIYSFIHSFKHRLKGLMVIRAFIHSLVQTYTQRTNSSPESGSELRSPQRISGMEWECDVTPSVAWASSARRLSLLINIIVWMSFTSLNSGSQCMWQVDRRMYCFLAGTASTCPPKNKEFIIRTRNDTVDLLTSGSRQIFNVGHLRH